MDKKKKIIAIVACVLTVSMVALLVGFVGAPGAGGGGSKSTEADLRTVTLEKGDLQSTVSATGTIYSSDSTNVYSNVNHPVKTVYVEVGDYVEAGTVLAELDTRELKLDIVDKQTSISTSQQKAQINLTTAEKDYENMLSDLDSDTYSDLVSKQQALDKAQRSLNDARSDYNDHKDDLDYADSVIYGLEKKLNRARDAWQTAEKEYNTAVRNGAPSSEIADLNQKLSDAEDAYNDVLKEYNSANNEYGGELSSYTKSYTQARLDYEAALENYNIAEQKAQRELESLQDSIEKAKLDNDQTSSQISLQKLQQELADCVITAPVSGTITSVSAVEGGSGNGLLFVIQNTEQLKIITNIKEYDVDTVQIGDRVIIKTDATGDREFEGTLTKIAPTSTDTSTGATTTSTDAEYEAEVQVGEVSEGLRIGMNTRLNVVTEERSGIFFVPYEAVKEVGDQAFVFVLETQEDGSSTTRSIPVKVGIETNLYIEVSGDGLQEGMQIVRSAQSLTVTDQAGGGAPAAPGEDGEEAPAAPGEAGEEAPRQDGGGPQGGGMPGMPMGGGPRGG